MCIFNVILDSSENFATLLIYILILFGLVFKNKVGLANVERAIPILANKLDSLYWFTTSVYQCDCA